MSSDLAIFALDRPDLASATAAVPSDRVRVDGDPTAVEAPAVSGDEVHTGQVFFPPAVMKSIYGHGSYPARGTPSSANTSDSIYRQAGARAVLGMKRKGDSTGDGYTGSLTVGVNPS